MIIKVTTTGYGYMGLPHGLVVDAGVFNQQASFAYNGKRWYLEECEYEEQLLNPVDVVPTKQDALAVQVGGGHYKGCKIQPIEFIFANKLGYAEGNIVKYITRWRNKNGVEDLKKIIHYVELLIQQEEKGDE